MITVVDVLKRTERWLRDRGSPSPRLDAELLIAHALGIERLQIYLSFDKPMSDAETDALRPLVKRRGAREPVAWIVGSKGFHHLDLAVTPGVLVPRPDTETLVEATLSWIGAPTTDVFVADVGCGSGAVGLAIAAACPQVKLYATDLSPEALACTRVNVERTGLTGRVGVLEGNLLDPIPAHRRIDWVVSNPPYIRSREIDTLEPEVSQHEPRLALDGGPDGLGVYRQLIPAAARRALLGVLVEVGHDQAGAVAALMREAGLEGIRTWQDIGKHERVVGGRKPVA